MKLDKQQAETDRLIEREEFPFEFISALAERESWRKEIYRPIYHIHKWWAKRLGSIFRGILLGSVLPDGQSFEQAFYSCHDLPEITIFDPFMGSGTTIGEASKLGMTAFGCDINPVACESVRVALSFLNRKRLKSAFQQVSSTGGRKIRQLYKAQDQDGNPCDVLYYFWVKQARCTACEHNVDLFSKYLFAQNAYPKKKPEVQIYCPTCEHIFEARYQQRAVTCDHCQTTFDPRAGSARGTNATCKSCNTVFTIVDAVSSMAKPPDHKLYAKLVLSVHGTKQYLPITEEDLAAYAACEALLEKEIAAGKIHLPEGHLADGYNTRQAMRYNYGAWRDFFNARQLLALGWLQQSIVALPTSVERDALLALFSGALEFNNLFASYKGEGTGAVRHMFSHHILKPERMPIEANVWGTVKSSGSFSGLFKSRLLRALDYQAAPFEVGLNGQNKVFGTAKPMGEQSVSAWLDPVPGTAVLSCGDSAHTGLPDNSIDLVVTDPPFFDNVHYSELADFFYAWQVLAPRGFIGEDRRTTRSEDEVQDGDAERFSLKLQAVFAECRRVLKKDGLLIFTYHHSRFDGWAALAKAVYGANFTIVQAHPVRAELAVAKPKSQAKEPILIDAIIVCRQQENDVRERRTGNEAVPVAVSTAAKQIKRLAAAGHQPTVGDKFVIGAAQFFVALGSDVTPSFAIQAFAEQQDKLRMLLTNIEMPPLANYGAMSAGKKKKYQQLTFAL